MLNEFQQKGHIISDDDELQSVWVWKDFYFDWVGEMN